jgi:hypothetical protein
VAVTALPKAACNGFRLRSTRHLSGGEGGRADVALPANSAEQGLRLKLPAHVALPKARRFHSFGYDPFSVNGVNANAAISFASNWHGYRLARASRRAPKTDPGRATPWAG